QPLLGLGTARANREKLDFSARSAPLFTGVRPVTPPLAELRELIDWQFFFLAWELKGKFPAILETLPAARDLFDDANALLDEIIADQRLTARGGYGFGPAATGTSRMPLRRSKTCTRNGSGVSGPRSATRRRPTIASRTSSSRCSGPATSAWRSPNRSP